MPKLSQLREVILNGVVGVVAGGSISLLNLIPSQMLSDRRKLIIGAIIFLSFLIWIVYRYARSIFEMYQNNAELVKDYLNILPATVQFEEYRRDIQVNASGDGIVNDRYRIKNISDSPIPTLSIRQFCDVYEDIDVLFELDGEEASLELDQPDSFVELNRLRIDGMSISTDQAYERQGYLIGENTFQEKGRHKISFNAIGELQPEEGEGNSTADVELNYTAKNGLDMAMSERGDYIACDCYHPTESIELTIHPPDDYQITLHEPADNPEAIDVIDIHGRIYDNHEKSAVSKPREVAGDRIRWKIEDPKVNYRYVVHFRCSQSDDAAEGR